MMRAGWDARRGSLATISRTGPKGPIPVATFGVLVVILAGALAGAAYLLHRADVEAHPFFPDSMLEDRDGLQRPRIEGGQVIVQGYEEDWYASVWRGLVEPSLYLQSRQPAPGVKETIRFTWLPSFFPAVVVRLDWLATGDIRLSASRAAGNGWRADSGTQKRLVRLLNARERMQVSEMMTSTGAFSGPDQGLEAGPDGSSWIFEAASPGQYHYEAEWAATGSRRDAGRFMAGLTGWDLEEFR